MCPSLSNFELPMNPILLRYRSTFYLILVLISGIWLLLSGCEKKERFNSEGKSKLVVLAEITAGDSAYIPVSKSLLARLNGPIDFKKINNVTVVITESGGSSMLLQLNNGAQYADLPASIYTGPDHFKPNTVYSLRATHPDLGMVEAITRIPAAFNVSEISPDGAFVGNEKVFMFEFEIRDNGNQANYYTFEALKQRVTPYRYFYWKGEQYDYDTRDGRYLYNQIEDEEDIELPIEEVVVTDPELIRLSVLTGDSKTENVKISSLDSSYSRIFLTDSLFNGTSYSTSFYVPADELLPTDQRETGQIIIRIKSVGKDFFDYLVRYEKYKAGFGILPFGNLSSPEGNILNGFGVFGGSYKLEWKFDYEDFD